MVESKNASAIKIAADLGRKIQREYPHVAEDYSGKYFLREIVERYDIPTKYSIGKKLAVNAVRYALKGYSGGFEVEAYTGLIKKEEFRELSQRKVIDNGNRNKEQHEGIFGLDEETEKLRIENSAEAKGIVLWSIKEFQDTYRMYQDPNYKFKEGRNKGKPNLIEISRELNAKYHNNKSVRNSNSVNLKLISFRKEQSLERRLA